MTLFEQLDHLLLAYKNIKGKRPDMIHLTEIDYMEYADELCRVGPDWADLNHYDGIPIHVLR